MANFNNSLKSLVNQQMIAKAARTVDEKESNISTAVSTIIPSLLGVLLTKKGQSPQVENILNEAGNLNIMSEVENLCEERPSEDQRRIGDDFLQHLLGDKAADFTNPIADKSNISRVATNRLISMIAPIVAGYLGNKMVRENWTKSQLFAEIDKEKNEFKAAIPAGVIKAFDLESILNTNPDKREPEKANNKSWIIWVILIILLLLLFLGWRSCNNRDNTQVTNQAVTTTTTVQPADRTGAVNPNDRTETVQPVATTTSRELTEMNLPDGSVIRVYKGGVEEEMIKFMESDDYKNASDNDLRDKWFQFDDIAFEFNSATQLKPESERQLNNIAAILKSNKDAKVKIAGFADRRGSEEANMNISEKRAKTIENMLDSKGVGSQVVRTQGYGDEYAKHSASASNEERAEDRDIALRFVKQ
ncbi:MAG: OmpA family protein [Bacteroidales bacterium]|nr:OmpA family protein [Bacteroidales bacterium]